ncbi:site-specific integrase, partial [[Ruminococcus] torques]|uniref:site-specific integrase n=1 Tax=[Ruminococcus] torques TaxID=33039 RepID=UPI0022E3D027
MKEKRRDSKGRILHTGESQRTDGKYLYKYVDAFGNTKYVYAWRLTPTDPTPKEKREKPSLRELEQQIRRDIEDGIDSTGKKMTLCQLYLRMKDKGFSYNTINNHKRSLKASFYIAIQDDCVRKNPFDFKLSEVLENDTKEKVISELCGLTVADIDFKNEVVIIDHQLLKSKEQGYYIETPKTKSGIRQVPLSRETIQAFQRVMKKRP